MSAERIHGSARRGTLCAAALAALAAVSCSPAPTPAATAGVAAPATTTTTTATTTATTTPTTATTTPTPEKAAMPDFDALVKAAAATNFEGLAANTNLYRALFQLPQWQLMAFPDSKTLPPGLNIETHDGKKWVMAFTDHARLTAYATARKQLNADGSVMMMAVPSQTSFAFFESLQAQGVFGVRFNQGELGWFASMDSLRDIHTFLKNKNEL